MTKLLRPTILGVLFCLLSGSAFGETPASIHGKIIDKRGYVMAGLTVRARNNANGTEYQTTSQPSREATDNHDGLESLRQMGLITEGTAVFWFEDMEPGQYVLISECPGVDRILGAAFVEPGKTAQVELLALPLADTGNIAVDKFVASSDPQGGRYPAGNISYLNVNDALDLYFMWIYF